MEMGVNRMKIWGGANLGYVCMCVRDKGFFFQSICASEIPSSSLVLRFEGNVGFEGRELPPGLISSLSLFFRVAAIGLGLAAFSESPLS